MNTPLLPLLLITALFTLVSCGGGNNSTTNLEISSSFMVSNAGFDGGLIITGKSEAGVFSKYVTTGTSLNLSLPKANWEFSAVGWAGPSKTQGPAFCGSTLAALADDQEAVTIEATQANCTDPRFGANTFYDNTNKTFFPLQVLSCGTLYENPISNTIVGPSTSNSFCSSNSKDYQRWALSARVTVLEKDIGGNFVPSTLSLCSTAASGSALTVPANLPTRNVPLRVELFEASSCAGTPEYAYEFRDGLSTLAVTPEPFDKVIVSNTVNTKLFLPYNDLRKGWSPFMQNLPRFACGGSDCVSIPPMPAIPTGASYIGSSGSSEFKVADDEFTCADITFDGFNNVGFDSCTERDGGVYVQLHETTTCDGTNCSLAYSLKGVSQPTMTFITGTNYHYDIDLYNSLWRMLGNSQSTLPAVFNYFDDEDRVYGTLSKAREMLGPDGAGGLYGNTTCSAASGTKYISLFDDGKYKNYQATIDPSTKVIPNYLCNNSNSSVNNCSGLTFDKKITIRELIGSIYVTTQVIHLKCTGQIGQLEKLETETHSGELRTKQEILGWNTSSDTTARYELLSSELVKDVSDMSVKTQRTNFERAEKNGTAASDFTTQSLSYESKLNGFGWDERLTHTDFFYLSGGSISSYSRSLSQEQNGSMGDIFQQNLFDTVFQSPTVIRFSTYAKNSGGDLAIAWVDSGQLYLSRYKASTKTWTSSELISSAGHTVDSAALSINDSGVITIGYIASDGTNTRAYKRIESITGALSDTPTALSPLPSSNVGVVLSKSISTCSRGDNTAIVWTQDNTFASSNSTFLAYSINPGFSTWTLPSESEYLSSTNVTKSKCGFTNDTLVVAWTDDSGGLYMREASLPGISFGTATNPFSGSFEDVFIEQTSAGLSVTAFDGSATNQTDLPSGGSWSSPTTVSMSFNKADNYCRTPSTTFGTTPSACPALPTGLKMPTFNSSVGVFNFGVYRLKPDLVNSAFTPPATFKAQ